ncbi:hypothetical protein D0Z07_6510 [Hyphodiscus hymeniophilus]|uniref:Velvet domain-containing protein n=1 Tax=Hyphodiscus hymeniophilus TaxID=353542 RepID=A0A9P6VGU8_9HELO|nr:hypothetical protein D0Z07_6510 [Hyphodiscus hymeniophilus]
MFAIAVQPSQQTKPGIALYPPVVARLSSEISIFEELSQVWAVASLMSPSGEVLYERLRGKIADSAHPMADAGDGSSNQQRAMKDRAYFYFPDLVIDTPGRYRIRISLMRVTHSFESSPEGEVQYDDYVDTHSIVVNEGLSNHSRPSSRERTFLRILEEDGQDIPSSAPA